MAILAPGTALRMRSREGELWPGLRGERRLCASRVGLWVARGGGGAPAGAPSLAGGGPAATAVVRDRAFVRAPRRVAVAAQVARDDFVGAGKEVQLRSPIGVVARKAVDENERRGAMPRPYEVHPATPLRLAAYAP